jgi:hypothetical protein
MPEPFQAKVIDAHRALDAAGLGHAFGGAIALAYYSIPRATVDIDINVFVPGAEAARALSALAALGVETAGAQRQIDQAGQCRVHCDATPIDLFFANLDLHTAMARNLRRVHFAGELIPILAPDHLMVCKALFDRQKDWTDIQHMLLAVPDLRVAEVRRWMDEIAGPDDARTQRLDALLREMLAR